MPDTSHAHWRTDRPAEGFYTTELPALPDRPVRTFLPTDYQPRYPYPLVVVFHQAGGSEETGARLLPRISRRNYLGLSLRGPHTDGRGFGWSDADPDWLTDYLLAAVEQTRRTYHVHSERVFLLGVGDGAAAAYRAGLRMADRVAGVVALNGLMPKPNGRPLFSLGAVRGLPVFIGHGVANPVVPYATAERDFRLLYAAGADVKLTGYPTSQKLHAHMLRDVNRWVMGGVTSGRGVLLRAY
ncbi:esterase [bacterium]|nr:esterase [bacterium]